MRKYFISCSIAILSIGLLLPGQENPTESSNLYDRMGVIAERGLHGAVPEEHVDLFSGSLVLKYLDVTLPGPNGFDLNIWRVYNSKVNTEHTDTTYSYPQQETYSWVGYGWSMHMGRLLNPDSTNPTIEFPDGRQEGTYPWIHDSSVLITRNFLKLKKYDAAHGGLHTLYFQDGTVWIFGATATLFLKGAQVPVALVTQIANSYGHEINVSYHSGTSKLMQVTDALGRVVTFNLDGSGNLDSITAPHLDGTATYDYTVTATAWGDSAYTRLDAMKPPVLNQVSYGYNDATHKELNQVTTSYGGTISYSFSDQDFAYFDTTMHTRALESKTIQFSAGNTATWEYEYGDYSGTYPITIRNMETGEIIMEGNGGYTNVYGPAALEQVWFFGPQPESDYGWLAGLLAFKYTFKLDGSASIANEQYIKESEQISAEVIFVRGRSWGPAKAALEIGGYQTKIGTASQYTAIQYNRATCRRQGLATDIYVVAPYPLEGQESTKKTSSEGARPLMLMSGAASSKAEAGKYSARDGGTTALYPRFHKSISYAFEGNADFAARNMLTLIQGESYFDQDELRFKATTWEYFSNGAIQKIMRWQGAEVAQEWNYTYSESPSGPAEITITIDPPGGQSGIETTIYKNGTLAKRMKPGYVEFDRTVHTDGLIHTETNQHGGEMTFAYDDVGRITNIAMPSGFNPITAVWSQNSVEITRGGNVLTKHWDGMGRNLGFAEAGAGVTLHSRRILDGEGRVVAESKGAVNASHKTVYELNENGQPVQVTDPTGKWTKFAYVDNACTITDMKNNQKTLTYAHLPGLVTRVEQEGTVTASSYQGENRLVMVESSAPGAADRIQGYVQNDLDQLTQEYHPETGSIYYTYNDEGNLATKIWGSTTFNYAYNAANQLLSESDGDETISFTYDANGRVKEINTSANKWRRFDIAYNQLGAVTSEKQAVDGLSGDKTIAYAYDGNGLLEEITYPDGRAATYANNALLLPQSLAFNSEAGRVGSVTPTE